MGRARGLISGADLALLKPTAYLINTSRAERRVADAVLPVRRRRHRLEHAVLTGQAIAAARSWSFHAALKRPTTSTVASTPASLTVLMMCLPHCRA